MPKPDFTKNWGIVGHQPVVDFLKTSIKKERVSHAYLFAGQAGLGKRKVAKNLLAALLCLNKKNDSPCQACSNCQQLEKNIHPDVNWIERTTDAKTGKLKKNITIEQIREVRSRLGRGSFLNSYKIAVINKAELMSLGAANALLKILEEPNEKTIIILITANSDYLPETIISRCQQLKFESVSRQLIYDYLTSLGSSRTLANDLGYLANGRPGVAIKFYRDDELLELYQKQVKEFLKLTNSDSLTKFKIAEELSQAGEELISKIKLLGEILDIWAIIVRDVILLKNSRQEIPDGLANVWLLKQLKTAKLYKEDSAKLNQYLQLIEGTKKLLGNNINPRLALENLVLNF